MCVCVCVCASVCVCVWGRGVGEREMFGNMKCYHPHVVSSDGV